MKMYEVKAKAMLLGGCLFLGLCAGAAYALLDGSSTSADTYNVRQLTEKLQYSTVHVGRLQCEVLEERTPMYNKPSGLDGKVIEYLSKGVRVDYLETVTSMDKSAEYAVTNVEMSFQKLWGRRHIIPAGTEVLILRADDGSGETRGRILVDGKYYEKTFDTEYLQLPYVGQWKKVDFEGKPGYIKFKDLSDPKLK